MADLGEIGLLIKTYGEAKAIQAMEDYTRSIRRNLNEMRSVARVRASLQQQREREIQRELNDNKRALDSQRQLAMEYRRLKGSIDPVSKAQQQYTTAINLLDRAMEQNVLTTEEYHTAIQQLKAQMELAGYQVNEFGRVLDGAGRTLSRQARAGLQQAGYQFGDFAVQVQSGTSAIVALGQQGSQLLGLFGFQGAIAGAVLAVGTAIANVFIQSQGAGKTLDETIQDLTDTFDRLGDSYEMIDNNELNEEFGSLTGTIRSLASEALKLDSALSLRQLTETLDRLRSENIEPGIFQNFMAAVASGVGGGMGGITYGEFQQAFAAENFASFGFDIGKEVYEQMTAGIMEQAKAGDVSGVAEGLTQLFSAALPYTVEGMQAISTEGLATLEAFRQIAELIARVEAQRNGTAEAEREINQLVKDTTEALEEARQQAVQRREDTTQTLATLAEERREAELLQGLEGRSLLVAQQALEREQMRATLRQQGLTVEDARFQRAMSDLMATQQIVRAEYDRVEAQKQQEEAEESAARLRERVLRTLEQIDEREQRGLNTARQTVAELEREGIILAAIAQYGEDSAQADQARAQAGRMALEAKLREVFGAQNLNTEQQAILDAALEQLAANQENESLIASQAEEARELAAAMREAAAAMSSLSNIGAAVEVRLAQTRAQIDAIRDGADAATAGYIAGQYARAEQEMRTAIESGTPLGEAEAGFAAATANLPDLQTAMQTLADLRDSQRGGRGGRGARGQGLDAVQSLQREIQQRQQLLTLRGEERDIQEEIFRIQNSLGEDASKYTYDQISALAQQNVALKQQEQQLERIKQLSEQVADAFSQAFVDFVSGAKNAREVAADLLRMLAQMAINFAFRALFASLFGVPMFAKGGVFKNGSVTPFADGGVVASPTFFPMSGGRTGLMGEAGPEAIMPLNRGPDGKLGVRAAKQEPQLLHVVVTAEEGEMFAPRVRQISGNVAVQVSQEANKQQSKGLEGNFSQLQKRGTN